jgi:predicted MFS family arabinose efflux permease
MYMMAMQVGNGIGPIVLGSIADWFGLQFTFYAAAISMAIGVLLFSIMIRGRSSV